jgi:HAD superfamily hydrolase (TIGR01544 family)
MDKVLEWAKDPVNNCISKDWKIVQSKLEHLKLSKTHIIADFDMTLTQYMDHSTGQRSQSSHGAFESWSGLNPEIKAKMRSYYHKYYPMEISHSITHDEKYKAMVEWWSKAHEAIMELKITRSQIKQIVQESKFVFRPLLKDFIELVTRLQVPLLVFSAGLGDVIFEILTSSQMYTRDMAIVSNMMIFDDQETCIGFQDPLIHTLNKNEATLANDLHAAKIDDRQSVILMGDSLGDLKMADGIKHDVKLTIGFLNHDYENLTPIYLDSFDIVLTNDTSLEFVVMLLKSIPL